MAVSRADAESERGRSIAGDPLGQVTGYALKDTAYAHSNRDITEYRVSV